MKRFLGLAAVLSVLVVIGPAGEAQACSCAVLDPAEMLEDSDAAFVGILAERPTEPIREGELEGLWVFEVEEWVKGDLGSPIGVHAALDGAACGFEMEEGDRAGIFLRNAEGRASSGLCSTTTPEALLSADDPLAIDGEGPPVFLVAAPSGRARLAMLDASGRLLQVLEGESPIWSVSVCPGDERVLEATEEGVAVRDTSNLEQVDLVGPSRQGRPEQAWCLDEAAETVLGQFWDEDESRLALVGDNRPIHRGDHRTVTVADSTVAVQLEANVELTALPDGETIRIPAGGRVETVAFSPEGKRLLISSTEHLSDASYETRARVYTAETGALQWESDPLADTSVYGWLGDERLLATEYPVQADAPRDLLVEVGSGETTPWEAPGFEYFPVTGGFATAAEGTLYLVGEDGTVAEVASLPSPSHRLVAVLDPAADIQAAPVTTEVKASQGGPDPTSQAQAPADEGSVTLTLVIGAAGAIAVATLLVARRRSATTLPDVD